MAYLALVFAFFFVALQRGEALRCWHCSTDIDASCYDPFNATRFIQQSSYYQQMNYNQQFQRPTMPLLKDCPHNDLNGGFNRKQMCMKRVTKLPYNRVLVSRECRSVDSNQAAGTCGDRSSNVDFCEYCDYDGCNGASTMGTNILMVMVPLTAFLFLRR